MKKTAEILLVIGGVLLVFSAVITFKTDLPDKIENIIYYRGILLGSVSIITGSAIITKNFLVQNMLFSLGSGNLALLIMSSLNLLWNGLIDLDFYFDYTVWVILITLPLLIIIRLWWSKILAFLRG